MEILIRNPALTDGVSLCVIMLLSVGLSQRKNRSLHPRIMRLAFVLDLGLVLFLEVTRGAVERASQFSSSLLAVHVGVAILALLTNVVLLWTGTRLLAGEEFRRRFHRRLAWTFMVLRILTFLTAFLIPVR